MVFQSLKTLRLVDLQATLGHFDPFCELKSHFGVERAVSTVSHTGHVQVTQFTFSGGADLDLWHSVLVRFGTGLSPYFQ